ncbi:UNVERIFIED_CONTAM: hypothetical protein GTU68_009081, partial [Idotea baltica]|nr:hypothetical protein [Idotea baltica]
LSLNVEPDAPADEQGRTWGVLSAKELLACSWSVAVAGQEFSIDQFRALAENAGPLAKVGETWVELDPGKVNSTVQFLANQAGTTSVTLLEALRLGFGLDGENDLLPIVDFKANGWLQQLLDSSRDSLPKAEVPEGFKGELRPYQQEGLAWLVFLAGVGVGGCLADDMGLGKTVQLLALMEYEREQARRAERPKPPQTLLIVPMSTLDNWEQESKKFTPDISIYMHHGTTRLAGEAFRQAVEKADLVLTTYSLAFRDELLFGSVAWGRIALDEAQNIKNQDAKQTKAIRALENCQRLALTGTPLENHLDELWSIFDFLNPGFLGSIKEFRTRFAVPIERYQDEEATKNLSSLIQPFLLRRLKSDPTIISDLPDKIEMTINTTLTEEQSILYRTVLDDMIPRFDKAQGIQRKGLVLATITRLKQICNHPALYLGEKDSLGGRSAKLNRLEEILDIVLAEGDKALIFTQYAQMGHLLAPHLRQRFDKEVLFLHGGLPKKARDKLVNRFKEKDGPQIFILSLKAGGFGLNLTEANQVIHYDQWWNPAVQEQATDRAYRIGQTSNVQVRTFVTSGTLEERINEMLQRKREL